MSQTQMQKKLQFQVPQHDLDLYGVSGPSSRNLSRLALCRAHS